MNLKVALPSGRTRTYSAKWEKEDSPLGWRVLVPSPGGGTTGIVVGVGGENPKGHVISFPDDAPLIGFHTLRVVEDISSDYLLPRGTLLFKLLPSAFLWKEEELIKPAVSKPTGLDPKSLSLIEYVKKRRGVKPENLKKRFGSEIVNLLLKKGFLKVVKEWRSPSVEEKFFKLKVPLKEALGRVRSEEKRRILVFLSGKSCVSEEELSRWNFSKKHLRDLIKADLVEETSCEEEGTPKTYRRQTPLVELGADREVLWGSFEKALERTLKECEANLKSKRSTLILFADREEMLEALYTLREHFGGSLREIHSGVSPKRIYRSWFEAQKEPSVVVGTYIASLCPAYDLGTVILFDESSPGVKLRRVGNLDLRRVSLLLAKHSSSRLVFTTPAPSLPTFYLHLRGKFSLKKELPEPSLFLVKRNPAEVVTSELVKLLEENSFGSVLFLVPKQGYSYAYCPRCEALSECPECGTFLTYSRIKEKLYCTNCGYVREELTCPECEGSLEETGFGIEKAVEVVENTFGIKEGFSFSTYPSWERDFDAVVVLSADNLLSVPSYRSREEMFLYLLRSFVSAKKALLVQTMFPEELEFLKEGRFEEFYKRELEEREREMLPPFWRLALVRTRKRDIEGYVRKLVSPFVRVSVNLRDNTYDLLVRFKERGTLLKLRHLRERFGKDIIEVRVDPF
ncbi:MAG: hypothetical protein GXO18_02790 [Aquificae bacterium]|nr:hypothetical protein [Aquificota bacterium]